MSITTTTLPEPSPDGLEVEEKLVQRIRELIDANDNCIGFDRYMQTALYEPELGYYLGGTVKFGAAGDFITAPELSPLFGRCIAREAAQLFETLPPRILEFGAGSGALALSLLTRLDEIESLPDVYSIVELSADLRERQHRTLSSLPSSVRARVQWLNSPPSAPFDGLIVANEILDALPVKIFKLSSGRIIERCVGWNGQHFDWVDRPADDELIEQVRASIDPALLELGVDYTSEINQGLEPWLADLAGTVRRAVALIIDYGFSGAEYYHADRADGTLLCHYRHRAHRNPFFHPGLQDITASVDFTRVAETADRSGLRPLGYCEQACYLLSLGLLEEVQMLSKNADERTLQRFAHETKILTLPNEMGTRFKVMALGKGYDAPLHGFHLRDDRHRL